MNIGKVGLEEEKRREEGESIGKIKGKGGRREEKRRKSII